MKTLSIGITTFKNRLDDVILCHDFKESLYKVINSVPKNWEHIYLGARLYNYDPLLIPSIVQTTFKTSGTYSYIIRKTAYDKVIKKLSSLETTTDDLYSYMITDDKQLNSFTCFPFIVMPGINSSYIWPDLDMNNIHNVLHPSHKYFKNNIK